MIHMLKFVYYDYTNIYKYTHVRRCHLVAGSGTLEFSEFLTMLPQIKRSGDTEDELEEAFRVFDKEGNGQINASELRWTPSNSSHEL